MVGEHYASGNWTVKVGSEDEFVARWRAFLSDSTKTAGGFGTARLLRDSDDPRHFLSFSEWADAGARDAWKSSPEFAKGLAACRELCDDFAGADYSQAAIV
jgi:heme-degrading monooxygenase HmoA